MRTKFEPRPKAETGRRGDQSPHPPYSQLMARRRHGTCSEDFCPAMRWPRLRPDEK